MLAGLLVEILWIDRLAIFQDYVHLLDSRKLLLEDGDGVVHGHGNDRAPGLLGNLKRAVMEGKDAEFLAVIAGSFRKDTDRDAFLYIINGVRIVLRPSFGLPCQEKAVQPLHPVPQQGILKHLLLGNISGEPLAAGISKQNVKVTSMVADKKHGLIRNILLANHGHMHAGYFKNHLKSPLYHPQALVIAGLLIEFSN